MAMKIKIMIVDDDSTTRKILGMYVKQKGFEVVMAENGFDALEKLARERVSLIMTDLNMPNMDGIELIKNLKANPDYAEIPVMMITTESDEVERQKAMAAGAAAYLVKPVTGDAVAAHVKEIIKQFFAGGHNA